MCSHYENRQMLAVIKKNRARFILMDFIHLYTGLLFQQKCCELPEDLLKLAVFKNGKINGQINKPIL